MKKLSSVQTQEIKTYAAKFGIPPGALYELDTAKYWTFLMTIDTAKFAAARKNHIQPLQALYFDSTGKLICWYINCNAGGFPNLKWDRDSAFSRFPPKQQAPLDSFLTYDPLTGMINHIPDSLNSPPISFAPTRIVVFWNRWMGRQSERLIELVQKNAAGQKASIIYVNDDNLFTGLSN